MQQLPDRMGDQSQDSQAKANGRSSNGSDGPEFSIPSSSDQASEKLSYKFQRLREQLRQAIASGELSGKLPGERRLARRFEVNAKTLSKALTDLAAEGLLDRSIGRGTFVKTGHSASGTASHPTETADRFDRRDRWLIICDEDQSGTGVIEHLRQFHDNLQIVTDTSSLRPSFLNSIKAAIDVSVNTPDSVLRDLMIRNITVVLIGREPTTYSINAVLIDCHLAASCLARDMMLSGHRRFLAVERRGQTIVTEAVRRAAQRYATDATVDSVWPTDVPGAVEQNGATAVICDTRNLGVQVKDALDRRNIEVPQRVSLAAIGSGQGDYPCSGYFVHTQQKADTVVQLIRDSSVRRPMTIWLTGAFFDAGTIAAPPESMLPMQAAQNAASNRPTDFQFHPVGQQELHLPLAPPRPSPNQRRF